MHEIAFLRQLVVVFGAGLVVVLLLSRLRLPTIAGFIVAGAVMGPSGLHWVEEPGRVEQLAEVGVVLLLFTIGLEFPLTGLRRTARAASLGGAIQLGVTALVVVGFSLRLGLSAPRGVFYGFLVALSSTAIVLRALAERGETDAPQGRFIVGVLLFQDLCVVPMMLVLPMLAGVGRGPWEIALALGKAAAAVAATAALARLLVPRVLRMVAGTRRRDLFVLTVLFFCLGIAWLTSLAGLSLALGAFLAGMALADSHYGHQALSDMLPLRDTFSSLFFISMGMLLDLKVLISHPAPLAGLTLALLFGKSLLAALAALAMGFPLRLAILAGIALAQVGEFSFVLAGVGRALGLMTPGEARLFLAASVLTMLVTPVAIHLAPRVAAGAGRLRLLERLLGRRRADQGDTAASLAGHVVVLGYGVGGQMLGEALRATGVPHVVVDIDSHRVRDAQTRGEPVLYGDATSREILLRARVPESRQVVVLLNDPDAIDRAVRVARELAREVPILARTRYLAEIAPLQRAGATEVVAQEFEASLDVVARVLRAASVPRNVIGERMEQARQRGPASEHRAPLARRGLGEVSELAELKIESFLVGQPSWISGRTLAASRLREYTGATLVAIGRQGATATHAAPSDTIHVGDILYLVGGAPQVTAALDLLELGPEGRPLPGPAPSQD